MANIVCIDVVIREILDQGVENMYQLSENRKTAFLAAVCAVEARAPSFESLMRSTSHSIPKNQTT